MSAVQQPLSSYPLPGSTFYLPSTIYSLPGTTSLPVTPNEWGKQPFLQLQSTAITTPPTLFRPNPRYRKYFFLTLFYFTLLHFILLYFFLLLFSVVVCIHQRLPVRGWDVVRGVLQIPDSSLVRCLHLARLPLTRAQSDLLSWPILFPPPLTLLNCLFLALLRGEVQATVDGKKLTLQKRIWILES